MSQPADDAAPSAPFDAAEDSSAIPGLHELRQWRGEIHSGDALPPGDETPAGAPREATPAPPPGPTLGERLRVLLNLRRDDTLALARLEDRRGLLPETLLVLGVSLGASAIWSVMSIIDSLTQATPIANQQVTINNSYTPDRPWLDLANQLVRIFLTIVPVFLAFYLLNRISRPAEGPYRVMGLTRENLLRDLALGAAMAAGVGIPGLGLYAVARALGANLSVVAGNLAEHWWTIPVYILLAAMNGLLEEVVMVGYLFTRWTQCGWGPWRVILTSALIRGAYHLYQGFGGFIGNFIMGAIFGWVYQRTKRVLPLVIAHTLLDIFSFIGYALLHNVWAWL